MNKMGDAILKDTCLVCRFPKSAPERIWARTYEARWKEKPVEVKEFRCKNCSEDRHWWYFT